MGVIVVINVMGGFVQIVDSPSRQAFVSQLVEPGDLASAVSLNGVVMNTARVVGPALAGVLIVTVGTTPCFAVNAVSYLAVVGALVFVHPLHQGHGRSHRHGGGVRHGLRYARSRQQLWLPLVMMALVGLLAFNFAVVLPVFAKKTFHGSGGTYGLLSTMLSLGSIAGSLGVGFIHHPRRPYLVAAAAAFGVFLAATALAPTVPWACVALVLTGAGAFSFVTLCSTTLQLHSSAAYRGRIMALWVFVYIGTTPIGSILSGWIVSAGGPRAALPRRGRVLPGRGRDRCPRAHTTQPGRHADGSPRLGATFPVRCGCGHVGSPGSENGLLADCRGGRRRTGLRSCRSRCSNPVSRSLAWAEQRSPQSGRVDDPRAHSVPPRVLGITSDR